ncbi:MAG TPA: hypothetical protein PK659_06295 [Methanothrix sp.]|nr:hypothetical protein [Methanothrix sp.]HOK58675.1 hypothetical protein [Methanothrix sp.]HOL43844.1 hypothetical protein [Methanothrix sp.]HPO88929.1 hypothetical protein [Methanothrix sp.]
MRSRPGRRDGLQDRTLGTGFMISLIGEISCSNMVVWLPADRPAGCDQNRAF